LTLSRARRCGAVPSPWLGTIGAIFILLVGLVYLDWRRKQAAARGEGYGEGHHNEPEAYADEALPNPWIAILPLVITQVNLVDGLIQLITGRVDGPHGALGRPERPFDDWIATGSLRLAAVASRARWRDRSSTEAVVSIMLITPQHPHPYPNTSLPSTFHAPSIFTSTSRYQRSSVMVEASRWPGPFPCPSHTAISKAPSPSRS